MDARELLKHALALLDKERAELASSLIDSLDPAVDADTELAWQQEIARRLAEIESGQVKTVPWDEVRLRPTGESGCDSDATTLPSREFGRN